MRVLGEVLVKQGRALPDRIALIDPRRDRQYSFAEVAQRSARIANGLAELGVTRGDRVAMLLGNCAVCAELPFAVGLLGAVTVNVNERLKHDEVEFILADSGAAVVVTSTDLLDTVHAVRERLPQLRHVVTVDGAAPGTVDFEAMVADASPTPPQVEVAESSTAMLIYTSGTTGRPKGVRLTHANLIHSATNFLVEGFHNAGGVYLACVPYYHAACIPHMAALMRGMTVIAVPFDLETVVDLTERYRVTDAFFVPTMIALLLQRTDLLDAHDLSSLQTIFYAAAPIPVPVLSVALERFGPIFVQMYGLSESATISTVLRKEDHRLDGDHRRLSSCGREITHVEVRIGSVDEECPPGERGEVLLRGANVMAGYWGLPEASEQALKGGWLHTGDIGIRDEDGYLYIVDRKHDMIITGGANVYPREVEDVLYSHPAVAEAAVIGVPDQTWGETVLAVIAPCPDRTVTEAELVDFCAERLADYKKPRQVVFVDTIVKTPVGKIDKATLRAGFARMGV
ncbi:long-chain-fatty-acid--CoA ligase (plasmid) [Pseudonocardia bannensis]|uniref:Long-chain-fatty-acid--CoA ligase n=1 Tax=Pseudonocardia bannensis TaxID=630973 RepID=A0A848DHU5_9PSEU|nr:long-chain-fatty-acid--CoA ligase [Pseudonocardia bannensis]NMH92113.1 long-chain-fatty-acid--CoA ligase [Pseudonocardia bannensis]